MNRCNLGFGWDCDATYIWAKYSSESRIKVHPTVSPVVQLMEEILHHLKSLKS